MFDHQSISRSEDVKKESPESKQNETTVSSEVVSSDFSSGTIALKSIQSAADDSPRSTPITQLQAMANAFSHNYSGELIQLQAMADARSVNLVDPIQRKENNTGLPDHLKTGMENLSGMSMDDVKVHRNSDKPAQLQAHAFAQGTDIHLGPGQEKHLPHELGHVVQQKQGRVKPTIQMKGKVNVNDDAGLEKEADVLGAKALNTKISGQQPIAKKTDSTTVQRQVMEDIGENDYWLSGHHDLRFKTKKEAEEADKDPAKYKADKAAAELHKIKVELINAEAAKEGPTTPAAVPTDKDLFPDQQGFDGRDALIQVMNHWEAVSDQQELDALIGAKASLNFLLSEETVEMGKEPIDKLGDKAGDAGGFGETTNAAGVSSHSKAAAEGEGFKGIVNNDTTSDQQDANLAIIEPIIKGFTFLQTGYGFSKKSVELTRLKSLLKQMEKSGEGKDKIPGIKKKIDELETISNGYNTELWERGIGLLGSGIRLATWIALPVVAAGLAALENFMTVLFARAALNTLGRFNDELEDTIKTQLKTRIVKNLTDGAGNLAMMSGSVPAAAIIGGGSATYKASKFMIKFSTGSLGKERKGFATSCVGIFESGVESEKKDTAELLRIIGINLNAVFEDQKTYKLKEDRSKVHGVISDALKTGKTIDLIDLGLKKATNLT